MSLAGHPLLCVPQFATNRCKTWVSGTTPATERFGKYAAMTENIYDNDEFFAGYLRLPRSVAGLDGAPEWPALRAMLPDLHGGNVLDLGCGFGWFCRWAREQGAAYVVGIDVSEKML